MIPNLLCRLCSTPTEPFHQEKERHYFRCSECKAIQLHPNNYLTSEEEKARYQTHNNDVDDLGYQEFVQPIVNAILESHTPKQQGLDFGCGTGPVITKLLHDQGYNMRTYDPFFDNNQSALQQTYDYIACCEVIEHFHHPAKEFKLLKSLLNSGGRLYCKTDIYTDDIDFSAWYYKNDPTHVFFYHPSTLQWIASTLSLGTLEIKERLIIFSFDDD